MKFLLALLVVIALVFAAQAQTDNPVCALPSDVGKCKGYFIKYFFNSETKACEEFVYGGCPGNGNNFDTIEDCQETCSK